MKTAPVSIIALKLPGTLPKSNTSNAFKSAVDATQIANNQSPKGPPLAGPHNVRAPISTSAANIARTSGNDSLNAPFTPAGPPSYAPETPVSGRPPAPGASADAGSDLTGLGHGLPSTGGPSIYNPGATAADVAGLNSLAEGIIKMLRGLGGNDPVVSQYSAPPASNNTPLVRGRTVESWMASYASVPIINRIQDTLSRIDAATPGSPSEISGLFSQLESDINALSPLLNDPTTARSLMREIKGTIGQVQELQSRFAEWQTTLSGPTDTPVIQAAGGSSAAGAGSRSPAGLNITV